MVICDMTNVYCANFYAFMYICRIGWIYVSEKNSFPFGYDLPELMDCLQRDSYRVYYGLKGSISIVLAEGYGIKHQHFRSLMKSLITQEGYSIKNYHSYSLLTASYVAETASVLIKALHYMITEQKWNTSLVRLAMRRFQQLSIKHDGITGSLAMNSDKGEKSSTFVIYNIIPSLKDEASSLVQPRAYIFHDQSTMYIQYIDVDGVNSSKPTIVYADGTTNPPQSIPERSVLNLFTSKHILHMIYMSSHLLTVLKYKSLSNALIQASITITTGLYALFVYYGEKNYEYFNAKWMYRRGDINFSNSKTPILCHMT